MKEKGRIEKIRNARECFRLVTEIIGVPIALIALVTGIVNLRGVRRNDANIATQRKEIDTLKEATSRIALSITVIEKIRNAEVYLEAGGDNNKEKALEIYHELLTHPEIRRRLDNEFLNQAVSDERNGYIDDALSKYRLIFKEMH